MKKKKELISIFLYEHFISETHVYIFLEIQRTKASHWYGLFHFLSFMKGGTNYHGVLMYEKFFITTENN